MTIYDNLFPLGLGTNRFLISGPDDTAGIDNAVNVVVNALDAGVSYIDVANTYSHGMAETVCKLAFQQTTAPHNVTVKSSFFSDMTAEAALRRVDSAFKTMGIDHAFSFVIWNIASYQQFQEIMKKDSLYEGALKAKEQGMIDHICFSTHASPQDIIKIIESGAFEGATIPFSVLNSHSMKPVLDCAQKYDVGIIVMNPLGGGVIPSNRDYFSFLCNEEEENPVQAALRYISAHPAIKIILSGMSSGRELAENLEAFHYTTAETDAERIYRVERSLNNVDGFCTGCRYCDGCPQNIPVYKLMQAYNTTLFPLPKNSYGGDDPILQRALAICRELKNKYNFLPPDAINPCISCGRCERHCTAHLPIIARIHELYDNFAMSGFSKAAMFERLKTLIGDKRRIAFYTSGIYTNYVLSVFKEAFPDAESEFEIYIFDSDPILWGSSTCSGIPVYSPEAIASINPEIVIISNYKHMDEIYQSLTKQLDGKIPVVKLHEEHDVPWLY